MASKYGHGSGDISSFYGAAQRVSCPNRPFGRWADVGQRENGRSGGQNQIEKRRAWAVLGGIPSGWGQFGAVKKWAVVIGGLRRQLNALYMLYWRGARQREKNGPGSVEPAPVTPRGCTKMVPPRLARKMSVMSVEPPARGAPGGIAAERVHRPGSRRLGGVEATGASPGVAPSRPHRSGPRAGPVRRTPCARGAWGGEPAGGWASDLPAVVNHRRGPHAELILSADERARANGCPPPSRKKKGTGSLLRDAPSSKATGRPQKSEKSFALATNASRRRSDRACPSLEEADVFAAMKLRPFPARISETVRNIDRAR